MVDSSCHAAFTTASISLALMGLVIADELTDTPRRLTPESLSARCQLNLKGLAKVFETIDNEAGGFLKKELYETKRDSPLDPILLEKRESDMQGFYSRKQ
jgi:hypothetical protein